MMSVIPASEVVPSFFRHTLINIEPFFAFNGAVLCLFRPALYTESITQGLGVYVLDTQFLYTTIAGGWLHFAFVEAVVMRAYDDLRLWQLCCAAMLLSDVAYSLSAVEAAGGLVLWSQCWKWSLIDWTVVLTTLVPAGMRACILLGIGMKRTAVRRPTTGATIRAESAPSDKKNG